MTITTYKIELYFNKQISFGELADSISPYEMQAEIVKLESAGNGNPLIKLTGTYKNIVDYIKDYSDGSDEDMKFFVEQIK